MHYEDEEPDQRFEARALNPPQLDGWACVRCGLTIGGTSPLTAMIPVGYAYRGGRAVRQVSACAPGAGGCDPRLGELTSPRRRSHSQPNRS